MPRSNRKPAESKPEWNAGPTPQPLVVAETRLKSSPCIPLHELACKFADGTLVVRGTVPTKYAKRLALACVASVEGVQMIIDMISVQFPLA